MSLLAAVQTGGPPRRTFLSTASSRRGPHPGFAIRRRRGGVVEHVCELLEVLAERLPDRPAIIAPDGTVRTYAALRDAASRVSGRLDALGVGRHVVVLVPVGTPLYEVLLGVFWGGRTAVLVDPSLPRDRLDAALRHVGVHAFVSIPKGHLLRLKVPTLRRARSMLCTRSLGPVARSVYGDEPGPMRSPEPGEPALLTFTTGTTGVPKAMGRSHRFLLAQHDILAGHMGLGDTDVDLPTLPVFLLNSLACGATCVLPDGDLRDVSALDPQRLSEQVRAHGVTTSSGSPAFFEPWVSWLQAHGQTLPELRRLFTGGARVPATLVERMVQVFPNAHIEVLYGSTEAEPMASLDAHTLLNETAQRERDGEGTCVGTPVLDVRLVDPDTGDQAAPDGVGEVWVSGGHVNRGYYRNPAADAENKVTDGSVVWHRTGDAAWQDAQGRLWLVGRISARVHGRYPFPVETRAEAVAGVRRAALVAVGDVAVLAFSGTADADVVREATGVADCRRIQNIPVDPRHRAKVDRDALVRLLGSG